MRYIFLLMGVLLWSSCSTTELKKGLVLKNFQLIDLKSDRVDQGLVVIIQEDSILDIVPEAELYRRYSFADSLIIDGKDRYLMPALEDMHVHLQPTNPSHKEYLKHFLGYGITRLRVMAGNAALLAWKDSIKNDELMGPDLKVASPLVDGRSPLWGDLHQGPVISDTQNIDSIVSSYKMQGYDLIKLYPRVSAAVYEEFLERAEDHKIPVAAHIPFAHLVSPDLEKTFRRNSPSFEHFTNFGAFVTGREVDSVGQPRDHGYYGYKLAYSPDPTKIRELVQKIQKEQVWICPTSVLWYHNSDTLVMDRLIDSQAFRKLDRGLKKWWLSTRTVREDDRRVDQLSALLLKEMAAQRVPVLAGTDFPNPFLIPGLSLHQEIHNLVRQGYSNLEALKAATVYPAQYWNEGRRGYLEKGKEADLIILTGNPLQEITHTTSIQNVISDGKVLDPGELRKAVE